MITHDGTSVPRLSEPWDPNGTEWLTLAWDEDVACHGAITASSWVLPDNWTNNFENEDVSVTDCDNNTYDHCNRVLLSTTETSGLFVITNRVSFSDQTQLDRSVRIRIKEI